MNITLLKAKLHGATVTDANIYYRGSITIDANLLEQSGIREYELVHVVDVNNGARLETYVIRGEPGSGTICLNGAAARLVQRGDKVIIIAYVSLAEHEVAAHQPRILILGADNRVDEVHGRASP
jgi:aspartate 1-decarboxylase